MHKWKTIHCKAEKVQKIGHDVYLFLWKAFGKAPTSSSIKLNAEGQQQFPLHTTGFEITHRILLALSGQVKPNKHRISVFCTNGKQSIGSRKGTKDRPSFSFFWWKAFRKTPKSSSMAEGKQEFHLHTTGFETQDLFGGFGFPEWAISVSLHQPSNVLPIFCQIAKCDIDPSKLTKKKLKEHHQRSTFFTDLVANILY